MMVSVGTEVGAAPSRRADILRATWELLATTGASHLTIRRVAQGAAVDPALIYHYFGSKRGLLGAARDMPEGLSDILKAQRGPLERLRILQTPPWATWVSALVASVIDDREDALRSLHELIASVDTNGALPRLALLGFFADRFLLHVWSAGPDPAAPFDHELLR
ncbi:TetR/AcrR family transcriptional regulator [Acidimicrobium ferrooxidans]|nr:TetR/AcrR family transcriptional regulator [Acidimicrobium ferrooxidans]